MSDAVRVGLLGCGNVGAGLVSLLLREADAIEARTGIRLEITRVAVRDLSKPRPAELEVYLGDSGIYCRQIGKEGEEVTVGAEAEPPAGTPLYMF